MDKLGILLTALWVACISVLLVLKWNEAASLSLNEWGDFLAGVVAPIAFLWLIVSYNLQRKELQLNTKALEAQGGELQKQNLILLNQAKVQKEQLELALEQRDQDFMDKIIGV